MKNITLAAQDALDAAIKQSSTGKKLVIVGSEEDLEAVEENRNYNEDSVEEILNKSAEIKATEWFAEREAEMEEWEVDFAEMEGEWPDEVPPPSEMVLIRELSTGELKTEVACVEVSVDHSWKLPAELKCGGWNECPMPEVHCAVWRYWEEKYGARIIGISSDIIEAVVDRPPTTQEEAMALAREQYLYASDIVDQGTETISNLAATLQNGKFWFFWWD